ncbi:hypothetical protein EJO68_09825 [Variovorax atrisoli]|uniref:hypothetical protein n=1 Tax=Variovorax atrisoli TaxID=3394203 RepID=UPI000F7E5E42|nr:hypothetical protein [Variovorax sp. 369]RTD94098.1 hypothetical protein EJO68_09825 [Variovorax sp. 369]
MSEPQVARDNSGVAPTRAAIRHGQFRLIEFYLWVLIAGVCLIRVLIAAAARESAQSLIRDYYGDLLLSFFVVMFPIVFLLVFGSLPLEALRRRRYEGASVGLETDASKNVVGAVQPHQYPPAPNLSQVVPPALTGQEVISTPPSLTADTLVLGLARSSKNLADGIYRRSGVYLLVGVMVAFSGLAFFYLQTSSTFNTTDLTGLLVSLAPKFGILFFIEFVAFFFLKQYRTSMEEFRYYEAIKRHREEILVLLKVGDEQSKPIDAFELVRLGQFFSIAGRLQKEESTEILEARKLEKNETAVLERAIDAIAQIRK